MASTRAATVKDEQENDAVPVQDDADGRREATAPPDTPAVRESKVVAFLMPAVAAMRAFRLPWVGEDRDE